MTRMSLGDLVSVCTVLLLIFSQYTMQDEVIPQIWSVPDTEIYADDPTQDMRLQVLVSPKNTSILLGVLTIGSGRISDEMKVLQLDHFTSSLSRNNVRVIVDHKMVSDESRSQTKWSLRLVNYQSLLEKSLHILATNSLGTVTSRPFRIVKKVLNPFPLVHHESVEFLMGNVGQILCMIPHSKPSPPDIEFLHDNMPINVTKGDRYKQVFLVSGAMVLLIRTITPQDAGSYTCSASLPRTTRIQRSDKITRLSVQVPKRNLKPRFRLSSHDSERGSSNRIIEVLEGTNLTLYCLYESAPVAEVGWYWPNSNRKYDVDFQFGTIFLPNIQKEDASDFSCSVDDVVGRTFTVKVIENPRFTSTPFEVLFEANVNKTVKIICEIYNERSKRNFIKWFHNGRFVNENIKRFKFVDNVLYIKYLTKDDLGIFQCWLENDQNLWSTGVTVVRKMGIIDEDMTSSKNSGAIIEKKTPSGLTIHFECSLNQSQMSGYGDFTVRWFRRGKSLEALDLTSSKYVTFIKKSERRVILSIVNPMKKDDEGIYVCRLYGIDDNLLRTTVFRLLIEENKSQELNSLDANQRKSFLKKNLVSTPEVTKINDHVPALRLTWQLSLDTGAFVQIYHYRIQYQRKYTENVTNDERKRDDWSEEKMIDEYATTNEITIVDRQIFNVSFEIRFRVIAIPKVTSPMPFSRAINQTMIDNLSSDWSKPVNFRNIMNCKLTLSKTKTRTPTQIEVMWTHTCVRDQRWQYIAFNIIYASITDCIKERKCRREDNNKKLLESIIMLDTYRYLQHTIRIDREFGEYFQTNVTGLKPDTEYAIGIYGKLTSLSQEISFISISNIINVTTTKMSTTMKIGDNQFTKVSESNDSRNRIIFLVLGSLAGVLFVVAAIMFGMCIWYYMKKHVKTHKAHLKSHDPLQPALLFHYPPSSLSSPICYGSRIDPMLTYQTTFPITNNKFLFNDSQTINNSPITAPGTKKRELWPVNFFNHSPNKIDIADRLQTDRDSDLNSMCNSDSMTQSNVRRHVLMGADQASSTYSKVSSERRLSMGTMHIISGDCPTNFQNMTLPRHCTIPISFPEPPCDAIESTLYPSKFPEQSKSRHNTDKDYLTEDSNENCSLVPFNVRPRGGLSGSVDTLNKDGLSSELISKSVSGNGWSAGTYYDPYSSNNSITNVNGPLKSILPSFT